MENILLHNSSLSWSYSMCYDITLDFKDNLDTPS
jgi:hypothetical protein